MDFELVAPTSDNPDVNMPSTQTWAAGREAAVQRRQKVSRWRLTRERFVTLEVHVDAHILASLRKVCGGVLCTKRRKSWREDIHIKRSHDLLVMHEGYRSNELTNICAIVWEWTIDSPSHKYGYAMICGIEQHPATVWAAGILGSVERKDLWAHWLTGGCVQNTIQSVWSGYADSPGWILQCLHRSSLRSHGSQPRSTGFDIGCSHVWRLRRYHAQHPNSSRRSKSWCSVKARVFEALGADGWLEDAIPSVGANMLASLRRVCREIMCMKSRRSWW